MGGTRSATLLELLLKYGQYHNGGMEAALADALRTWSVGFVDSADAQSFGQARTKLHLLLEYQACVRTQMSHSGDTLLHHVARGFSEQRTRARKDGQAGHWAHKRSEAAHVKFALLMQARADPEHRNRQHETALDLVGPQYRSLLLQGTEYEAAKIGLLVGDAHAQ